MVKAKTGITLLKRLGFVLIALPEPFTTPIGVACVVASGYLSKIREAALNKHLHETFTRYLSHSKPAKAETDNKSHARQKVKPYTRTQDPMILWQNKASLPVETSHPHFVRQNRRDKEENTVHHSVDTESLSRRFTVTVSPKAENVSAHSDVEPAKIEKLIHHSVDTQFLARRYPVAAIPKAKTESSHSNVTPDESENLVHHSVDTKFLSRRYLVTDSSKSKSESSHSDAAPVETEELIHHNIDMRMLGRRYNAVDTSKVSSDVSDKPAATENVVHHTRHVSLSLRYPETVSPRTEGNKTKTTDTDEILEHHSIDLEFLSRRYQMV